MPSSIKKVFYSDFVFDVPENVYEPAEDSFLFAQNLQVRENDAVVDIGTGCGILSIIAAQKARHVFAVDVNPYAVQIAKKNAEQNRVHEKISFIAGDLFAPISIDLKFDLILFNAPYLPTEIAEDKSWLGRSWDGGTSGRRIIDSFVRIAPKHLEPHGRILLMQSTLSNIDETLRAFENKRLETSIIAKQDLPLFETLVLVEAERIP